MIIGRLDAFDRGKHRFERVVCLDHLNGKGNIPGGQRYTIMKLGIFHQVKRHAQTIFGNFPAFGQIGLRGPVLVIAQGRREKLCARISGDNTRLNRGIQVPDVAGQHRDQRPATHWLFGGDLSAHHHAGQRRRGDKPLDEMFHSDPPRFF